MRLTLVRDDRLALSPEGDVRSVAKPVNDFLGLREDDRYLDWLDAQWGELAPSREEVADLIVLRDELARVADEATDRVGRVEGRIDYEPLTPLLSQVTYAAGDIDVPSLTVLAAWALVREIERGVDVLIPACPTCQRPWFARGARSGSQLLERDEPVGHEVDLIKPYNCSRPAPGLTMTCAQLQAHDRFAREREDWNREYRKVMARKVRGTVSKEEFRAWKAESGPENWTAFDEWRARGGIRAPERKSSNG